MMKTHRKLALSAFFFYISCFAVARGQDTSVKPGINDTFKNPNAKEFVERFEIESREVFARREDIVAACQIKPGQTVADIGSGTGLFTRLFARQTGPSGRVIAVDIAQNFLDHVSRTSIEAGFKNVQTKLCTADSTGLDPETVDIAFICDTYHHFEFPFKTMASLHKAMKPGGRVIVIDFRREEGKSTDFVMKHVRAGQSVFEAEITKSGFTKVNELSDVLKENYFVIFEKKTSQNSGHQPK
jgi:predicted methyltransferase